MSKNDKTITKIRRKPTASDIKWSDLKTALESLGYEAMNNDGSRRKFIHKETKAIISCHKPHPSPNVGKCTIDDIRTHLIEHGFIKEDQ
jgi:predicted RNA binding protein YcfA (HicA-like mRNA interferase family)